MFKEQDCISICKPILHSRWPVSTGANTASYPKGNICYFPGGNINHVHKSFKSQPSSSNLIPTCSRLHGPSARSCVNMVLLLEVPESYIVKKYTKQIYQFHHKIKKLNIVKYVEFSISPQFKLTRHLCRQLNNVGGKSMKPVCDS